MTELLSLPPSDEELVELTLKDKEYFGYLVERYESKLTRYIRRLGVRNEEDQLDVLQEVFLKAYRNINGFDIKLKFSSWIYRIAHNEAVSWYRKRKVRPEGHLVADSEELMMLIEDAHGEAPDVAFDQSVNAEQLNAALQQIEERYREVLVLRFFEHKEYEEISDILKIPVGSVGTWLHRGKKQLARVIDEAAIRM
jgi:RNA polymerase sigma-70 factor (ECF subfamily)